jgi:hypothetical protein
MSPGLPVPVSSAAPVPTIQILKPEDIEHYADRLLSRSRRFVLGDPWLCPDCRRSARMMQGLLAKLDEAVGAEEAARLIAEISVED